MSEVNKIRVQSSTLYTIEVNNKGETISFDMSDAGLYERILKMYESINSFQKKFDVKRKEIESLNDEEMSEDGMTTIKEKEMFLLVNQVIADLNGAIDQMFGEGSAYKIFGGQRRLEMYDEFADQMLPHFEKAGVNLEKHRSKLKKKYTKHTGKKKVLKA